MNVAAKVRLDKEAHPEKYCSNPRCLWRRSSGVCPKHTHVLVEDHGSILLFRPFVASATAWLAMNTDGTWYGKALVVEPRYALNLAAGLREAGFVVEAA